MVSRTPQLVVARVTRVARVARVTRVALAGLAGLGALGWLGACGSADDDRPLLPPGGPEPHLDRAGVVNLIEGGGFLGVFAAVQDGPERPVPALVTRAGDCAVYQRPAPALCEPACDGVCEAPGVCVPWPRAVDVGPITVLGLRQPLRFVAGDFGYEPTPAPGEDLFDAGAAITVRAPGGDVDGFAVELTGVAPLAGAPQSLALVDGRDAEVTWTAADDGTIALALLVGWHGAPWEAMLLCETADDGALTIPGAVIAALPRATSGLESHVSTLTRQVRASVLAPAGAIELVVGSQRALAFSH